jgi:hypothetical protein
MADSSKCEKVAQQIASELLRSHQERVGQAPKLTYGPPLATCIMCMFMEASDDSDTGIQVGCGYIIVDREECQSMRHEDNLEKEEELWSR